MMLIKFLIWKNFLQITENMREERCYEEYIRLGKLTIGIIGVLVTGIFILARKPIAILFGASDKAVQIILVYMGIVFEKKIKKY